MYYVSFQKQSTQIKILKVKDDVLAFVILQNHLTIAKKNPHIPILTKRSMIASYKNNVLNYNLYLKVTPNECNKSP